jgi:hypothetical protein
MRKLKKKESRMREIDEYGGIVSGEKIGRQGTMTDLGTEGNSSDESEGSKSR